MNRRSTIKYLMAGGVAAAFGGGYHWLSRDRDHPALALDVVLDRLNALEPTAIESSGAWEVARTFDHLAQSVEFSMDGFPVAKSPLFQNTAGRLAFSVFQARGRMTHGLDEVIPGEVVEGGARSADDAHRRLIAALERFDAHAAPLQPHFAYGELDKSRYALAHAMHVDNHFGEFKVG